MSLIISLLVKIITLKILFVNFQKAFDTVDHQILIQKLSYYDIGEMQIISFLLTFKI